MSPSSPTAPMAVFCCGLALFTLGVLFAYVNFPWGCFVGLPAVALGLMTIAFSVDLERHCRSDDDDDDVL